jgi:hypothetical protein
MIGGTGNCYFILFINATCRDGNINMGCGVVL